MSADETPRLSMRILAKGEGSVDQRFWIERLTRHGVRVVSVSDAGLTAEGPAEAFEGALEVRIVREGGGMRMEGECTIRSVEDADPPEVYIPRRPSFFP